jgi:hypothetical protein
MLLAGCPGPLKPLVPDALAPASRDSAVAWSETTIPARPVAFRFKWLYRDERLRWPGRGTARFAPPDSLRIDYTGALGARSGAAVVVGDSVRWAEPAGDFETMMPAIPLMWAAFGIVRPPAPDAQVFGAVTAGKDAPRTLWRFTRGSDTLEYAQYARLEARGLEGEWRRRGRSIARSRTDYDAHAMPAAARIDFKEASARFELTMVGIDTGAAAVLPPALWRSRR